MKNRYNKIILITFIVLYLFEVASGSTIRKFLLKNSVYSCYVLDAYDKSKVLDSVKAFGSGDLLISQIMKCNMKNYDDFLIENISIRRNDGLLVVRNFSTIEAAQIYKYLTNKYSLPVRYKEQYIIDIPYIDQKRNERIAEVRNSLINDMKLVKTSTISEK